MYRSYHDRKLEGQRKPVLSVREGSVLPTNDKQLHAFPLEAVLGTEPRPQRWGGESVTTLPLWPLNLGFQKLSPEQGSHHDSFMVNC